MSHDRHAGEEGGHGAPWAAGASAVLVAYLLVPGPLTWWIDHVNRGEIPGWIPVVYAPVIFACDHLGPVRDFYDFYCGLFA